LRNPFGCVGLSHLSVRQCVVSSAAAGGGSSGCCQWPQ
jgi:hypothetical protein